jgi:hypothetical protein
MITRIALFAALFVFVAAPAANAVYRCGPQTDDCVCHANNPFPCCDNGGNCTWWAWEAACCNWGRGIPMWGNANTWTPRARAQGWDIRDCSTPVENAIANHNRSTYGHVAWVRWLNGGGVHVSEQGCSGWYGLRDHDYGYCHFNLGYIVQPGQVECNPGDRQTQGCGACGVKSRGCGNDGRWGGWSGCAGGGGCSPGQVQEEACCDCGTRKRVCNGSCQWGEWSNCGGPDPEGAPGCSTGKLGVCADGADRCVDGCRTCVQLHQPSPESCDGLDNDCNGETDEGSPRTIGAHPPAFAASIVDASYPHELAPGAAAEAWGAAAISALRVSAPRAAAAAAARIGYPVVAKIVSAALPHKSDIGGVKVGLKDEAAVRAAYRAIMANVAALPSKPAVDGVLIAQMVSGQLECVLGAKLDPEMGPVVIFGSGGVDLELTRDVALAACPLDEAGALQLIARTRAGTIAEGYRGRPALDRKAMAQALVALSHLMVDAQGAIAEVDVNPFLVSEKGGVALDGLVVLNR